MMPGAASPLIPGRSGRVAGVECVAPRVALPAQLPTRRYVRSMAVHLTRIYTRTGDDGTTGLGDFSRVPKTDPRLVAYADVDEANCTIGVALVLGSPPLPIATVLRQVQNDLFDVGADLCTPIVANSGQAGGGQDTAPRLRIDDSYIVRLEGWCDEFNTDLPTLDSFILPGGSPAAALLHTARVVTRRAERSIWALLSADEARTNPLTARYLNRLSDLLFILSRVANPDGDVLWKPGS